MIQLSDTKAAPGLGALLGAKPKAGGDASAFALAFGSLAADGQPGFSITLPRQTVAADGSDLPGDMHDPETGDTLFQEFGLTVPPMVADSSTKVREAVVAEREAIPTETPKPFAATQPALGIVPDGRVRTERSDQADPGDRRDRSHGSEPDTKTTDGTGPVAALVPAQPTSSPLPSVELKSVAADKATDTADAKPADRDPTPKLLAVPVTSPALSREPDTPVVPAARQGAPVLTEPTSMSVPVPAAPQDGPAPARPERAAVTAAMVGSAPQTPSEPGVGITVQPSSSAVRTAPEPGVLVSVQPAISPPGADGVSPDSKAAVAIPSAPSPDAAPRTASIAHAQVTSEATPPSAVRAAPIDRPALTARLQAAPGSAASPRSLGATAKSPADAANHAPALTPSAKVDAPVQMPAKFIPVERPVGAAPDRPAARRIAIAPVDPTLPLVAAKPLTVADLIPVEHRPRMSVTPIALVTDPASVGLSAPVEATTRITDPAPLDTQASDWIEGMIEQIDVMRDAHAEGASETTTTRIRLSPDALGGVEIVLSGEGEAIDVRINADTAAARTLLAEAAPRLTDMAEARGLKLAQGDAGQPGQHQAQRQHSDDQPAANRRRSTDSAETGGNTDERIA